MGGGHVVCIAYAPALHLPPLPATVSVCFFLSTSVYKLFPYQPHPHLCFYLTPFPNSCCCLLFLPFLALSIFFFSFLPSSFFLSFFLCLPSTPKHLALLPFCTFTRTRILHTFCHTHSARSRFCSSQNNNNGGKQQTLNQTAIFPIPTCIQHTSIHSQLFLTLYHCV